MVKEALNMLLLANTLIIFGVEYLKYYLYTQLKKMHLRI